MNEFIFNLEEIITFIALFTNSSIHCLCPSLIEDFIRKWKIVGTRFPFEVYKMYLHLQQSALKHYKIVPR